MTTTVSNKWPAEWTAAQVQGVETGRLLYEKKYLRNGGVARIVFNNEIRPGLHAISGDMCKELRLLLSDASLDEAIGVVILTSVGEKSFMTGGDVRWEAAGGLAEMTETQLADIQASMARCRKPIIAAVKGYCIGAGNHMAYFADLTIAAENAIFGQAGPMVGSAVDGHLVAYSIRVLGAKKAREMWYTCRRYNAQQALAMGLVNEVVPLSDMDKTLDSWSEEILDKSPTCITVLKTAFDVEFDHMRGSLGRQQALIAPGFHFSDEAHEAQNAFFEKRKPNWWKQRGMPSPEERGL